jgi:hypothetical protein
VILRSGAKQSTSPLLRHRHENWRAKRAGISPLRDSGGRRQCLPMLLTMRRQQRLTPDSPRLLPSMRDELRTDVANEQISDDELDQFERCRPPRCV